MRYLCLVLAALIIPACGSTKGKIRQVDDEFGPRVGNDKREDIAGILGLPTQRETIGEAEIWVYRSNQVGSARRIPFAGANYYIKADELVLSFDKSGVLKSYHANMNGVK